MDNYRDPNCRQYSDGCECGKCPADGKLPPETLKDAEARIMQEYRWGNLTKLGVANHLRRAGFRLEVAQQKANALDPASM